MVFLPSFRSSRSFWRLIFLIPIALSLAGVPSARAFLSRAQATGPGCEPAPSSVAGTKGKLLVASAGLRDPNFARSVILVLDHEPRGARGLIINRPSRVRLADVVRMPADHDRRQDLLYLGGPLAAQRMTMLARAPKPLPGAMAIFADVQLLTTVQALGAALDLDLPSLDLRVYAGFAAWAPGQLEAEIARGSWKVVDGSAAAVFSGRPSGLWKELLDGVKVGPRWVEGPDFQGPTWSSNSRSPRA